MGTENFGYYSVQSTIKIVLIQHILGLDRFLKVFTFKSCIVLQLFLLPYVYLLHRKCLPLCNDILSYDILSRVIKFQRFFVILVSKLFKKRLVKFSLFFYISFFGVESLGYLFYPSHRYKSIRVINIKIS